MPARVLCLVVMLGLAFLAEARMYQWVDTGTGSVQMSGTPPSWYRSPWGGPRVRVFENGRVVDDTAIPVGEDEEEALREEAFRQFDEEKQLQALKRLEKESLKEAARDPLPEEADVFDLEESDEQASSFPEAINDRTIDQLKDLIRQWDRLNSPLPEEQ